MISTEEITFVIEGNKLIGIRGLGSSGTLRIVIPEGVEEIEQRVSYSCREVEEIILPNSLKKIGYGAFRNCKKIKTITIPENVSEIEAFAFAACDSLRTITLSKNTRLIDRKAFKWTQPLNIIIPPDNDYYSFQDGLLFDKSKSKLLVNVNHENGEVVIPDGVESVEEGAFETGYLGKSISRIVLPSSLRSIQKAAFRNCNSLTEIRIPDSVTQIGEYAFDACGSLSSVVLPTVITEISAGTFRDCSSLKEIRLPNQIQTIGEAAFKGCKRLSTVAFSSKEVNIQADAFKYCTNLEELILPPVTKKIGNGAFLGCTSLAKVSVDFSSVEYCGHRAFQQTQWLNQLKKSSKGLVCVNDVLLSAPNLLEVTVPKTVRMIAGGAFHMKKALKRVVIPSSVEIIGPNAFSACRNLETIILSKGLKRIERNAFRRCSALKAVSIPDTVEYIDDYAFLGCFYLTRVEVEGKRIALGKRVFSKDERGYWILGLSQEELANPPMIEVVSNQLPANFTIKVFGIGAVLGYCRATLAGVSFPEDYQITYDRYLKRKQKTIITSPEKYGPAITYMQRKGLL